MNSVYCMVMCLQWTNGTSNDFFLSLFLWYLQKMLRFSIFLSSNVCSFRDGFLAVVLRKTLIVISTGRKAWRTNRGQKIVSGREKSSKFKRQFQFLNEWTKTNCSRYKMYGGKKRKKNIAQNERRMNFVREFTRTTNTRWITRIIKLAFIDLLLYWLSALGMIEKRFSAYSTQCANRKKHTAQYAHLPVWSFFYSTHICWFFLDIFRALISSSLYTLCVYLIVKLCSFSVLIYFY